MAGESGSASFNDNIARAGSVNSRDFPSVNARSGVKGINGGGQERAGDLRDSSGGTLVFADLPNKVLWKGVNMK